MLKRFINKSSQFTRSVQAQSKSQKDASAFYEIGVEYLQTKHYPKALDYLQKASNGGIPQAFVPLAQMYENGYGVEKDLVKAETFYRTAIQHGITHAHLFLAKLIKSHENVPLAFIEYQKAVLADLPGSLGPWVELGTNQVHMLNNQKVGPNYIKYLKAIFAKYGLKNDVETSAEFSNILINHVFNVLKTWNQKHPEDREAQYLLAELYLHDAYTHVIGEKNALETALKLYISASETNPKAQSMVGWFHYHGKAGLTADVNKARQIWEKSSDSTSIAHLAELYWQGAGVKKDLTKAKELAAQSSNQGDVFGKMLLIRILMSSTVSTDQRAIITGLIKEILEKDPYNQEALSLSQTNFTVDDALDDHIVPYLNDRIEKWVEGLDSREEIVDRIVSRLGDYDQMKEFVEHFGPKMPLTQFQRFVNQPAHINELEAKFLSVSPWDFSSSEYKDLVSGSNKDELINKFNAWKEKMSSSDIFEVRKKLAEETTFESLTSLAKEIEAAKAKSDAEKDDLFGKLIKTSEKILPLIPRSFTDRESTMFFNGENLQEVEAKIQECKKQVINDPTVSKEVKEFASKVTTQELSEIANKFFKEMTKFYDQPLVEPFVPQERVVSESTLEVRAGTGKAVQFEDDEIASEKKKLALEGVPKNADKKKKK